MAKRNKETETNKENNSNFNIPSIISNLFSRLLGPIKILIRMHLKVISKELKKDVKRYVTGIISLFVGLFFIIGFWLLLNVLAIIAIKEFTVLNLFYSVLITTGANLFISIIMFISASQKFKKPFLKETKEVFQETFEDLKKG